MNDLIVMGLLILFILLVTSPYTVENSILKAICGWIILILIVSCISFVFYVNLL